eukprot:4524030-Amphidinium_carterae.1
MHVCARQSLPGVPSHAGIDFEAKRLSRIRGDEEFTPQNVCFDSFKENGRPNFPVGKTGTGVS